MPISCFLAARVGIAHERALRPELREQPVALVNTEGVLTAVSEEAEAGGVRAGQSAAGARALCEELHVLPYNREAYAETAGRMWDLLAIESSFVEPITPEICFTAWDGPEIAARVRAVSEEAGRRMRTKVRVGLGSSKFVARVAAERCGESSSAVVVEPGMEAAFLAAVPLERAAALDPLWRDRLERLGVRTLGDVVKLPRGLLLSRFGAEGYRISRMAIGEDGERVLPAWPPPAMAHGIQFEAEVTEEAFLHHALRICAGRVADLLAERGDLCWSIRLDVEMADGRRLDQAERLPLPTRAPAVLFSGAVRLCARMGLDGPVAGVFLEAAQLGRGGGAQLALLDESEAGNGYPHERQARLRAALGYVEGRYGAASVRRAAETRPPRRANLWIAPLGSLMDEPIRVATDPEGRPVRFWRQGRPWEIARIQTRWRETDWSRAGVTERTIFRVETRPPGFSELHQTQEGWRLAAVAD